MRIVVTLTTIPSREKSVLKTIESLKNNNIKPDVIYVNLRKLVVRINKEFSTDFKEKLINAGAKINECEDYGSLTKIIPTLECEKDPETLIITADDDIIYTKWFIEGLVVGYEKYGTVVGYSGIAYPDTAMKILGRVDYLCYQTDGCYSEILESGFGSIIKREWLNKFPKVPPETKDSKNYMYMCDDYFVSLYFDKIGIAKRIINLPWVGRIGDNWSSFCSFIEEESKNSDSLSSKTRSIDNYYNGMSTIKSFIDTNVNN